MSRSPRRRLPLLVVAAACAVAALGAPSAHAYQVTTLTGFLLPRSAAISPDGGTAYVTNEMANTVAVVDLGRREQTGTIPTGTAPHGVAFAPSGTRAYVTVSPSHLQAIDTATGTTVGSPIETARSGTNGGPTGVVITADGRRAFIANANSSGVGAVDLVTGQFEADILSGGAMGQPSAIAVHGSGTSVYTNGFGSADLWRATPLDNTFANLSMGSFTLQHGAGVALSPDGSRLYATSSGNDRVLVADTATRTVVAEHLLPSCPTPYGIAVSPSGSRLYVACSGGGSIAVLDAATGLTADTIGTGGAEPWNMAITADGSQLVTANSVQDSVTIVQLTPFAPSALSASASDTTATVSFTAPAANGTPITGYEVSLNGGAWQATTPATTASPLVATGLTPGTAYAIRVRAVDARGPGVASAAVSVTTQPPAAAGTTPRGPGITARTPRPVTAKDGSVSLRTTVTTPGPGRIVQTATSGSGKAKSVTRCTGRVTARKAGEHVVTCRLNAKARAALRTARLVLDVRTTFTATGATTGSSTTARVVVPRRR